MVLPTPCITFPLCLREDYGGEPRDLAGRSQPDLRIKRIPLCLWLISATVYTHSLSNKHTLVYLLGHSVSHTKWGRAGRMLHAASELSLWTSGCHFYANTILAAAGLLKFRTVHGQFTMLLTGGANAFKIWKYFSSAPLSWNFHIKAVRHSFF